MSKHYHTHTAPSGNSENYLSSKPPSTLTGKAARERWKQTIEILAKETRFIPRSNEGVLIGYCSAFSLLDDCEKSLAADGLLVDGGRDGKRRHPALAGKLQALSAIRLYAAELGLTPRSAARLPLPTIEEVNEFLDD